MTRVALVMIARDEARCIVRALASARPHVDRMIVLDTGSTDGTQAMATAAGAEVFDFAWCDDFAAARNASLDRSEAAWNLILDADEWIEDGAAALASLPAGGLIGHAQIRNVMDDERAGSPQSWIPRVLPAGVRYRGRIHEQPDSALPHVRLSLIIGHDGYLAEALARKGDRNEALLMVELKASPADAYLWFQLGKEHQVREHAQEAAFCFAEALRLAAPDVAFRHSLVVRALTAFKAAGQFEEAQALANAEHARWADSPDFFFALGDLYLTWAEAAPEKAASDYLPLAAYAWRRCLEIGERPDLDGAVAGRGSRMPAHNLAALYRLLGLMDEAARFEAIAARAAA